jgi:hypothetical protein
MKTEVEANKLKEIAQAVSYEAAALMIIWHDAELAQAIRGQPDDHHLKKIRLLESEVRDLGEAVLKARKEGEERIETLESEVKSLQRHLSKCRAKKGGQ